MSRKISVMIVDDHDLVRQGIALFIEACPEFELVAQTDSGEGAIRLCKSTQVDILLMDLLMPGIGGLEAARCIKADHPHIKIIILTSHTHDKLVLEAVEIGINGYLLKHTGSQQLKAGILEVIHNSASFPPEISQLIREHEDAKTR